MNIPILDLMVQLFLGVPSLMCLAFLFIHSDIFSDGNVGSDDGNP